MAVLSKPIVNLIDVYGPNYGPGWRPSIRNIILGVDQVDTHHCMICDKVPTKACYDKYEMGYCTALIMNALGLLELCGERLSTRSDGCGKPGHQFRDGVNRWLKDGLDGRIPTMPLLPHVVLSEMFEQFQHFIKTGDLLEVKDEQDANTNNDEGNQDVTDDNANDGQDATNEDEVDELASYDTKPWEQYTQPPSYREKSAPPPKEKVKAKKMPSGKLVGKFHQIKEKQEKKEVAKIEASKPKNEEVPTLLTRIPGSDLPTLRFLTNLYLTSHGLIVPDAPKKQIGAASVAARTLATPKTRRLMVVNATQVAQARFAEYSDSPARQLQMDRFSVLYNESVESAAKKDILNQILACQGKGKGKGKTTSVAASVRGPLQHKKPGRDDDEEGKRAPSTTTRARTVAGGRGGWQG
jgi:hypothetical protein